jgi:hypothetical protein
MRVVASDMARRDPNVGTGMRSSRKLELPKRRSGNATPRATGELGFEVYAQVLVVDREAALGLVRRDPGCLEVRLLPESPGAEPPIHVQDIVERALGLGGEHGRGPVRLRNGRRAAGTVRRIDGRRHGAMRPRLEPDTPCLTLEPLGQERTVPVEAELLQLEVRELAAA